MIKLIVGNKGAGKTKTLMENVNKAAEASKGNVVCIEKGLVLTYTIHHRVRLVNSEDYNISSYDELYGFLTGIMAGNYDITNIFVDATFKIAGKDMDELSKFIEKLHSLTTEHRVEVTFTLSCDEAELPANAKEFVM